jgi:hypothetical protein
MKAQCDLVPAEYQAPYLVKFMRSKGFRGKVLTHVNKGKNYPYNSIKRGFGLSYTANLKSKIVVEGRK